MLTARTYLLMVVSLGVVAYPVQAQDVNERTESAIKAAVERVAPTIVRIETSGGAEVIGSGRQGVRKGVGPTTGLIVSADGYIMTSSFNFANKPSSIYVSIPGRPDKLVAKTIATDTTRMLTLLKVDAKDLPVPTAAKKAEIKIGQWSVALGRALGVDENALPSVSVGIVSALGRMYGKALQTDAKVSPINYGGPVIAVDGTVQGILVPASPRGDTEVAGVEWYDSGIGFAVPLEDIFAVLPRMKKPEDLQRGLLGITGKTDDLYLEVVTVGTVAPDSAAAKAGIQPDDVISAIDGKPIQNYSQLQHILGPKYAGDAIALQVTRDGQVIDIPNIVLTAAITAQPNPDLGILPMRDDPEPGIAVRHVFPGTAAEKAGIKTGDRILKVGPVAPAGQRTPPMVTLPGHSRNRLASLIANLKVGSQLRLEIQRQGSDKTETVTVALASPPKELPSTIPPESTVAKAREKAKGVPAPKGPMRKDADAPAEEPKGEDPMPKEPKEIETGLIQRQNATLGREYWLYIPPNYTPDITHGLVVWLHPTGQGGKDQERMVEIWKQFCADQHYILMGPRSQNETGWQASETEGITQDFNEVLGQYAIDRRRVVAHGMGTGGQMAFYLGFNARDLFRGVATTGAVLSSQPKDNEPARPLSFFIVAGDKDPLADEIKNATPALVEKRFPMYFRLIPEFGKEYMDQKTLVEMCIWLDTLDRI